MAVTSQMWGARTQSGELIAISPDSVYVLTDQGLVARARQDLRRIEVRADYYGALSANLTIRPNMRPDDIARGWEKIRKFARYPGGLPDSLDRTALRLPPDRPRSGGRGTFLNP